MERLQKIIAKLEAKIKPLHDENQQLKEKLEELQLDHELALEQVHAAEMDYPQGDSSHGRIKELSDQVEALEMLKKLSDELEQNQRDEIIRLEEQLSTLRQEIAQHTNSRALMPQNDPSDAHQQQLSLLKLELEAANYELRAHKTGIIDILRESSEFDLEKLRYMLTVYGDKSHHDRIDSLFNLFKLGKIRSRDLGDSIAQVLANLEDISRSSPKFDADAARKFLVAITSNPRANELSDASAARAFDDPLLIDELVSSDESSRGLPPPVPAESQPPVESVPNNEETETLRLKISILSEKAARAAEFANSLKQAKQNAEQTRKQTEKLSGHVQQLKEQLQVRESEVTILKASQAPKLDTISYQHTLGLLSDTIKLLHKQDRPFALAPIKLSPARNLSAFAGTKIINQVWDAIDSFEPPKSRKMYIEQMRKLSLIDA